MNPLTAIAHPLEANARKVKNLSPLGIWLFIVGRVLTAFGLGTLAMIYAPAFASRIAWPLVGVGTVLFAVALIGFTRPEKPSS
jgi:hypothetical protein